MRFKGFIGPSYTLQSTNVDAQRCINYYPEMDESGTGKEGEVMSLVGTPGLKLIDTIGAGPIRGVYTTSLGALYVVSGNTLYFVDSNWSVTSVGTLLTSTGLVSISDNGLQLVCVDGPCGYYAILSNATIIQVDTITVNTATSSHAYTGMVNGSGWTYTAIFSDTAQTIAAAIAAAINNLSGVVVWAKASSSVVTITPSVPGTAFTDTTSDSLLSLTTSQQNFAQIGSPNFPGANTVTFQDGYFIFNSPGSQQFYLSGLNAITLDPTDVASKEGTPDNIVGLISDHLNLYLFGKISSEVWFDSGDTFPFQRIQGAYLPIGCLSYASIIKLQGSIFWLGCDEQGHGIVYKTQSYQPTRISTFALEHVLAGVSAVNLQAASAWCYQQQGHSFYCLNIPGTSTTWVYDTMTGLWHERASLSGGSLARHRASCHAFAYQTNVVGDYLNGNIYALDPGTHTDNGVSIPRIRSAPHITSGLVRLFHHWFQLDMETGVGTDGTGQGTNPQAVLDFSDDGGHKWSNQKIANIGAIGSTRARVIWRRLGNSRDRIYRVTITDPVKVTLIGADIGFDQGSA